MFQARSDVSVTPFLQIFNISPKCTLIEDYEKFFKEQLFCDVQFILGTEEIKIKAYMAFVAARSEYLRTAILAARDAGQQQMETATDSSCIENLTFTLNQKPLLEVRLPNTNPEAFENILHYIYTDRIDLNESSEKNIVLFIDIYQLADLYLMQNLMDCCLYYLETKMNLLNVLETLVYADKKKIQIIKDICLQFLGQTDQNIIYDMLEEFCDLDKHLLFEFIRNKLNPNKILIYHKKIENEQVIKAHKSILAARATYFQAMFRSFMPPDNKVNISIGDILPSVEAFQALLRYIYYGKTEFSPQDAVYLLQAHNFYGLTNNRLHTFCRRYLENNITYENVLETLEASDNTNNIDVKVYALKLITQDFARVHALPKLKSLSRELLLEIIISASQYKLVHANSTLFHS